MFFFSRATCNRAELDQWFSSTPFANAFTLNKNSDWSLFTYSDYNVDAIKQNLRILPMCCSILVNYENREDILK